MRDQADEEIHPAPANDPDIQPTNETFWKDARVVMPTRKETVTMRFNADLLE